MTRALSMIKLFQGPRAQIDRKLYKQHMQNCLENYPNLTIKIGSVHDILLSHSSDVIEKETDAPIYGYVKGVKLGGLPRLQRN